MRKHCTCDFCTAKKLGTWQISTMFHAARNRAELSRRLRNIGCMTKYDYLIGPPNYRHPHEWDDAHWVKKEMRREAAAKLRNQFHFLIY